jgi:hypothetical protein
MFAYTILRRNVVISNAFLRKNGSYSYVLAVLIGWTSLFNNVGSETGTFIDAQHPGYTSNDATNYTSNNRSDRTSGPFAVPRAPLDAAGNALRLARNGKANCDTKDRSSD